MHEMNIAKLLSGYKTSINNVLLVSGNTIIPKRRLPPCPTEAEEAKEHDEKLQSLMKSAQKRSQIHQSRMPPLPYGTCSGGHPGRHEIAQTGECEKEENEDA